MRVFRWIALGSAMLPLAGCDRFIKLGTDEVVQVADNQSQNVYLLTASRKLPVTATNISMHLLHFQDTSLYVKFDMPTKDAEAFVRDTVGKHADNCASWPRTQLKDWPKDWPTGGMCLEDSATNGPDDTDPSIRIAIIPKGEATTVLIHTIGD